eukprot:Colp12_sorted_trinity150504_noHs@34261
MQTIRRVFQTLKLVLTWSLPSIVLWSIATYFQSALLKEITVLLTLFALVFGVVTVVCDRIKAYRQAQNEVVPFYIGKVQVRPLTMLEKATQFISSVVKSRSPRTRAALVAIALLCSGLVYYLPSLHIPPSKHLITAGSAAVLALAAFAVKQYRSQPMGREESTLSIECDSGIFVDSENEVEAQKQLLSRADSLEEA